MVTRRELGLWMAGAAAAQLPGVALAQTDAYPSKPIKVVIGFPPGGAGDFVARTLAESMSKTLGQPVVVENKPGNSGILAASQVARSPADGYTLFIPSDGNTSIPGASGVAMPYDPVKDLEHISQLVAFPFVLVVHPDVPAKSVRELIALAKSKPGQLNFASWGLGSTGHLSAELFLQQAGLQMEHIPYKGSAPAVVDLRAGRVQVMFDTVVSAGPHIQAGAVRALGVTSTRRVPALDGVPTIAEAGLPGYNFVAFCGLSVPAGTPAAVIDKLARAASVYANDPEIQPRLAKAGMLPVGSSPQEFKQLIAGDIGRYKKLVQERGLKFE